MLTCKRCSIRQPLTEYVGDSKVCVSCRGSRVTVTKTVGPVPRALVQKPNERMVRARKRAKALGLYLDDQHFDVMKEESEGCCAYCSRTLSYDWYDDVWNPTYAVIDHVIPLALKGYHTHNNLVLACNECNSFKSDLTVQEFIDLAESMNVSLPLSNKVRYVMDVSADESRRGELVKQTM